MELHKKYGLGNCKCDFYLPESNTYLEITSFYKDADGYAGKLWDTYYEKILKKKKYTEGVLGARFRFIQVKLSRMQIGIVRRNMK
jgi:hypothetical protein